MTVCSLQRTSTRSGRRNACVDISPSASQTCGMVFLVENSNRRQIDLDKPYARTRERDPLYQAAMSCIIKPANKIVPPTIIIEFARVFPSATLLAAQFTGETSLYRPIDAKVSRVKYKANNICRNAGTIRIGYCHCLILLCGFLGTQLSIEPRSAPADQVYLRPAANITLIKRCPSSDSLCFLTILTATSLTQSAIWFIAAILSSDKKKELNKNPNVSNSSPILSIREFLLPTAHFNILSNRFLDLAVNRLSTQQKVTKTQRPTRPPECRV